MSYDAIVVGARCAGSPTAMLLARKGYKVLVLDRATFPSDTLSTHVLHPPGVAAMSRWGLAGRLAASGCPPIDRYSVDFGPFAIAGSPGTPESPVGFCPRRTVLDEILIEAAAEAGAEVRQGFSVDELTRDEGGRVTGVKGRDRNGQAVLGQAGLVIGADGRHSMVAKQVQPEQYNERSEILCGYYAYFSGLPTNGFETFVRQGRGFAAAPTNDDMTMVVGGWPYAEFEANRHDIEGNWFAAFAQAPEFAQRIKAAKQESKIAGTVVPNYFRKPFGPGWALVGDAGYNKDFITAQGISNAFLDAERCVAAVDQSLAGERTFEEAMGDYQATRDQHVTAMYEFTCQLATLEPPPPEMQQLLGAVAASQASMDQFIKVMSGVVSPAQFFAPDNVGGIFAAARGGAWADQPGRGTAE